MHVASPDVHVRHLRRERWLGRLAFAAFWAAGVVPYVAEAHPGLLICGMPVVLLAGTAFFIARNHGRSIAGTRDRGRPGSVSIGPEQVVIDAGRAARRLPRADIVSGWTEAWTDHEDVVLQMRSGLVVRFALPRDVRGRDVLSAAGVAPGQRAVKMSLGVKVPVETRTFMIFFALVVLLLLLLLVPIGGWMVFGVARGAVDWTLPLVTLVVGAVAVAVVWQVLVRPLIASSVRIGTDGIVVERLFRRRLVRRAALEDVMATNDSVLLLLTGGEPVDIPAAHWAEAQAVAARIREAMNEIRPPDGQTALLARLDREGRSPGAWLAELRALAKVTGTYRDASFDVRTLLDVVKDGAAPPGRRIAAAAALSGREEAEICAGLRVAASACVDERLRVALEKAADGELEEDDLALADEPPAAVEHR